MREAALQKTGSKAAGQQKKDSFFSELHKNGLLYLLTLPGLLVVFIFSYLPIGGIVIAFQDFNPRLGLFKSEFVGLKNFSFFFESSDTIKVMVNTLFLNTLFIGIGTLASVAIAIMLSELGGKWFKRITQTIVTLPYFLSWTVISMFIVALLSSENGFINKILGAFGIAEISFFNEAAYWPAILVLIKLWQGAGFGSIVYMATISGINPDIYESASIDGAGRWKKIRFITLPLLKPTIILMLLLAMGGIFYGDFGMIFAIVGRNPILYPTTDVIDTYVYRALMDLGDMSMAASVGVFQSMVGFILVLTANQMARKFSPDSALF
ncbi:sugar ABC transporter permease [Paenibacillus sp. BIHB 4019]|uniref:Sugar ABC transporter permease n=1 Tax=Paenibacillus sp. BIHB 4019 TaxID=1870819 RepID=A0A1B2DK68_9BACL|nr:ABC transporter permease subunit [Paenibacillus sp. BIHB 4019]ANY68124.1 sugar ABC transporter permease [Paenibacillus sp. BIHB 4019]